MASLVAAVWLVFDERQHSVRRRVMDAMSPTGRSQERIGEQLNAAERVIKICFDSVLRLLLVKPQEGAPGVRSWNQQLGILGFLVLAGAGTGTLAYQLFRWRTAMPIPVARLLTVFFVWNGMFWAFRIWRSFWMRRWVDEMKIGLINVLDLWVLCLGSGMSFQSAMLRVTEEPELTRPALRRELMATNQEVLAGASREESLRRLVRRSGNLPEMRSLVANIIHAERLGSSLAQTLRVYAESLRFRRAEDVKEMIQKLPAKLVFPLIFLVLPTLITLVTGPAWIRLWRTLAAR